MLNSKVTTSVTRYIVAIITVVLFLGVWALKNQILVHVDAGEIVVVQYPTGKINIMRTPGSFNWRFFGSIERFRKSSQYWFSSKPDEGKTTDQSLATRFNDGAHGSFSGSIRYDLPSEDNAMIDLYSTFRTSEAVEKELIGQAMAKAVYMTGPLMSSKESYSDRRNELINYIEDQVLHGTYQTTVKETETVDLLTQAKKRVNITSIARDNKGVILRQEVSPFERFMVKPYALNINGIMYDQTVEKQIAAQQSAIMQVQTSIAETKKAEQEALTVEAQGKAKAATAKWEQEVLKAKQVTAAESEAMVQKTNAERDKLVATTKAAQEQAVQEMAALRDLNVAKLNKESAEQTKMQQIALGEGEAKRKQLVMQADGALEQKLKAYVESQQVWAQALSNFKGAITPQVVTGSQSGGNGQGANAFENFMSLMTAKTAKDLTLDLNTSVQK